MHQYSATSLFDPYKTLHACGKHTPSTLYCTWGHPIRHIDAHYLVRGHTPLGYMPFLEDDLIPNEILPPRIIALTQLLQIVGNFQFPIFYAHQNFIHRPLSLLNTLAHIESPLDTRIICLGTLKKFGASPSHPLTLFDTPHLLFRLDTLSKPHTTLTPVPQLPSVAEYLGSTSRLRLAVTV